MTNAMQCNEGTNNEQLALNLEDKNINADLGATRLFGTFCIHAPPPPPPPCACPDARARSLV